MTEESGGYSPLGYKEVNMTEETEHTQHMPNITFSTQIYLLLSIKKKKPFLFFLVSFQCVLPKQLHHEVFKGERLTYVTLVQAHIQSTFLGKMPPSLIS